MEEDKPAEKRILRSFSLLGKGARALDQAKLAEEAKHFLAGRVLRSEVDALLPVDEDDLVSCIELEGEFSHSNIP
jgi:hypothetical protein